MGISGEPTVIGILTAAYIDLAISAVGHKRWPASESSWIAQQHCPNEKLVLLVVSAPRATDK